MKCVLVLLAIITFSQGCTKDTEVYSNTIIGRWELRTTSAAMLPAGSTYPPGNGNIFEFSNDTYQQYNNGVPVKSGSYRIVTDNTAEKSLCLLVKEGEFTKRIIFDNDLSGDKIFVYFLNNRLNFISGCYALDAGHTSGYERLPNKD